jgi:hypothetical protein
MLSRFRRTIDRWARFGLVASALLFVADSRASAACGGHTVVSFQTVETASPVKKAAPSNLIIHRPTVTRRCGQCPVAPEPAAPPCRGSFCSGQPAPSAVPVTSSSLRIAPEPLNLADAAGVLQQNRHADWLALGVPSLAVPRTDFIFHPPRQG